MTALSFEFYPPKTAEQRQQLDKTAEKLKTYAPDYVSCTFGAGGSTLSYTTETVQHLNTTYGLNTAPHLSCVGGSREEIRELLGQYQQIGCKKIVALRGDLPSGMGHSGDFVYAADLVEFIRNEHGSTFEIEVAAYPETHPQATDAISDLQHFKAKVDKGANGAITQYFYNADAYFYFVDAAHKLGIEVPIVPGIMPIANFSQLKRFSATCGADIPRWLDKKMQALGDNSQAIRDFGAEFVADLCAKLLAGGAPSLHFYTLNLAKPTQAVLQHLNIQPKL